ncbi:hypothetical protein SEA_EXIGUO_80 [Gordonia phage Exiguo]|nr:hypothetical protein SEA_EXIGUO_80 [Gordonia phage Exiguo]QOP64526.1 hypothetical protein SEA_SAM12_80 [Gordonia phage Sam12]
MRITFEMEDDNDDEFRVELFSSRKDLSPDDLIGLGASVMGNLAAFQTKEERAADTAKMIDEMKASLGNRGAAVIPNPPSED